MEKVKIDFNEPHITYRLDDGSPVVGVTTAIGLLDKPALSWWGFNQGKEPYYKNILDPQKKDNKDFEKMSKQEIALWAFGAGQLRKHSSLRGSVDKAANIGTVAHEILKGRELGYKIDNSNIAPDNWEAALQSVKSHDQWFKGMKIKTITAEEPLVSKEFMYGGTVDKYAYITGEETLVDYKSGKDIYDDYFIQLTAYCRLVIESGQPLKRAITVNMPKAKGNNFKADSRSVESLFEAGYFEKFLYCVGIYYANRKMKNYKNGITETDPVAEEFKKNLIYYLASPKKGK